MEIRSHRDLVVWQKAMRLTVEVYELTALFPRTEMYRLTSQLTRAAASVPANLAEGSARGHPKEFAYFVSVARGSLAETETFLLIAVHLGYVTEAQARNVFELMTEVGKMLTTLHRRLRSR